MHVHVYDLVHLLFLLLCVNAFRAREHAHRVKVGEEELFAPSVQLSQLDKRPAVYARHVNYDRLAPHVLQPPRMRAAVVSSVPRMASRSASNEAVAGLLPATSISPAAQKFFEYLGIQPAGDIIKGTGKNGRVLLSDAKRFVEKNPGARLLATITEMRHDFVNCTYGFEFENGTLLRAAFSARTPDDRSFFFKLVKLGFALMTLVASESLFSLDHVGLHIATATIESRTFHANAMTEHLLNWLSKLGDDQAQQRQLLGALYPAPRRVADGTDSPTNHLTGLHGALLGAMALESWDAAQQAALKDFAGVMLEAKQALLQRHHTAAVSPEQEVVLRMLVGPVRSDLVPEVFRETNDLQTLGDAVLTFLLARRLLPLCADGNELDLAVMFFGESAFLSLRMLRRLKGGGGLSSWKRCWKRGDREVPDLRGLSSLFRQPNSAYEDAKAAACLGLGKGSLNEIYGAALGARFLTGGIESAEQVLRRDLPDDSEIQDILTQEWFVPPTGAADLSGLSDEDSPPEKLWDRVEEVGEEEEEEEEE